MWRSNLLRLNPKLLTFVCYRIYLLQFLLTRLLQVRYFEQKKVDCMAVDAYSQVGGGGGQ